MTSADLVLMNKSFWFLCTKRHCWSFFFFFLFLQLFFLQQLYCLEVVFFDSAMCYKAYPLGVFVITPGLYWWWWSRNSTYSWAASSALLVLLEKQLLRNLVRFFRLPCPPSQHCWASEYLQDCSLFVDGYLYMVPMKTSNCRKNIFLWPLFKPGTLHCPRQQLCIGWILGFEHHTFSLGNLLSPPPNSPSR